MTSMINSKNITSRVLGMGTWVCLDTRSVPGIYTKHILMLHCFTVWYLLPLV